MRELLQNLAAMAPSDILVTTAYLDMRPQATGQNPAIRSGEVVLKDRLREIERALGPRGAALGSFQADADRIRTYLANEVDPAAQGVAIFASSGRGLFETAAVGVPFQNQVSARPAPDLFQLAQLLDEQETSVVAIVDTNTARLFVTRSGFLEEREWLDEDTKHYRKRAMGGWSQARYQRRIDNQRAWFAGEVAREIESLVEQEGAVHIVLAGDEVAIPLLQDSLSREAQSLVHQVIRLHIRAPLAEVEEEVRPLLVEAEAENARSVADRLVDAVLGNGLGVAGPDQTRATLELGQVDTLVLDPAASITDELRAGLVQLATNTGARIEVVEGHEGLRGLGGVGGLLRFRH
jgi:hypothetical protein